MSAAAFIFLLLFLASSQYTADEDLPSPASVKDTTQDILWNATEITSAESHDVAEQQPDIPLDPSIPVDERLREQQPDIPVDPAIPVDERLREFDEL
jgi:hypothetical protein